MALARKCDRCGKFYEVGEFGVTKEGSFVTGIAFRRHTHDSYVCYTDLCSDCIDEVKKFLEGVALETDKKDLYLD